MSLQIWVKSWTYLLRGLQTLVVWLEHFEGNPQSAIQWANEKNWDYKKLVESLQKLEESRSYLFKGLQTLVVSLEHFEVNP
jgi:hypothetical protein